MYLESRNILDLTVNLNFCCIYYSSNMMLCFTINYLYIMYVYPFKSTYF